MRRSTNDQPPRFRPTVPNYPLTAQLVRIAPDAVPDFNGVFLASIMQEAAPPASPALRNRETCYLFNPNPAGLTAGTTYRSLLMGAYQGGAGLLPLLAAAPCCPTSLSSLSSSSSSSRSSLSSSSSLLSSSSSSFSAGSGTKSVSSQSSLSAISPTGGCVYSIEARLDWVDNSDLDIYVSNLTDGGVCYFGALQAGGLTLNHDAHPICRPTPTQPEVITGVFAGSKTFSVWYNQYLNCTAPQAPTTQAFTVKNLGLITIQVFVGGSPFPITLTSGQSAVVLSSFAYAGYNTNTQVNFKGGTQVSIVCLGSSSLSLPSLPSSSFPSASLPSASSTSPTGIATVCCPSDLVASLLFATISNKAGTCTCLPNGATLSNVSLSPPTWHNLTIGTTCPGGNLDLTLQCQPSGIWLLSSTKCGISKTPTTVSCNPFSLSFIGLTCPGLCNSTFDITVTP